MQQIARCFEFCGTVEHQGGGDSASLLCPASLVQFPENIVLHFFGNCLNILKTTCTAAILPYRPGDIFWNSFLDQLTEWAFLV